MFHNIVISQAGLCQVFQVQADIIRELFGQLFEAFFHNGKVLVKLFVCACF